MLNTFLIGDLSPDSKKTAELEGLLADANGYLASFESVLPSRPSLLKAQDLTDLFSPLLIRMCVVGNERRPSPLRKPNRRRSTKSASSLAALFLI
jgi:hypothetical protein